MAISAIVAFSTAQDASLFEVLAVAIAYLVFGLPCSFAWLFVGAGLKGVLENPVFLTWFNRFMALLLVLSISPMLGTTISG